MNPYHLSLVCSHLEVLRRLCAKLNQDSPTTEAIMQLAITLDQLVEGMVAEKRREQGGLW